MTANPFAALLRDVPRLDLEQPETHMGSAYMRADHDGYYVRYTDALAALSAAVPADLAEAGKVVERLNASAKGLREFYKPGAVELIPSYTMDDAADTIRSLIATATAQAARIEGLEAERYEALCAADDTAEYARKSETAIAAEKARVAKLVEALQDAVDAWEIHNKEGDMMQGYWANDARAAIEEAKK